MSETGITRGLPADPFPPFLRAVQARFARTGTGGARVFATDAGGLFDAFLDGLPADQRQYHTCACCRSFLGRFGGLAVVTDAGQIEPALWNPAGAPEPYRGSVEAMARAVRCARITAPFLSSSATWGRPEAGGRAHLWVPGIAHAGALTAGQAMAAKREDFGTLSRALAAYDRRAVAQAVTLLKAESLYRSEKVMGPAAFLLRLHDTLPRREGVARDALIWRAVAEAPPGFCTPRSAMVGTLLEDIAAGLPFAEVKRRFDAKMHPLQYLRPQAAPSAGAIARAERIFAERGLAPALERRFARLDEIQTVWRRRAEASRDGTGGLFGHLSAKVAGTAPPMDMPAQAITWAKFARTVLPEARRIEVFAPAQASMNIAGMLTAIHPDAPPILQWDRPEARNPFSWYVYVNGSSPEQWGLRAGTWVDVPAIALSPSMWTDENAYPHQGRRAILILEGARDQRNPGLGLFPECLRSDLHEVRSVIEAHSKSRQAEERAHGTANGLVVGDGSDAHRIRVTGASGAAVYRIDRWE